MQELDVEAFKRGKALEETELLAKLELLELLEKVLP